MECHVSAFSRAGGRERNEDACGYMEKDGIVCCVLADGAGGHQGGDVASRTCVQSVLDAFVAHPEVSCSVIEGMLHRANRSVLRKQQDTAELADMRATLVVLLFDPSRRTVAWGHIGDSRLYLLRNGVIHLRTRDHSLVQSMVDSGLIGPDHALSHPESNVLFASIGLQDAFQPTVLEAPIALHDGDAFLLCSDGVWGKADDSTILHSLACAYSADDWLHRLEQAIGAQVASGDDNYSAIAVWCGRPGDFMQTLPA